jgi:hypothetical protein
VTKAYETLSLMPLVEGYSREVVEGRAEVLGYVKDLALNNEGHVQAQDKGIDLPTALLPSALALLAQVGWCGCVRRGGCARTAALTECSGGALPPAPAFLALCSSTRT